MIENSLQLRNLYKTRWTARVDSIKSLWVSLYSIIKTSREMLTAQFIDKNIGTQVTLL